jgi:hypothetical protein
MTNRNYILEGTNAGEWAAQDMRQECGGKPAEIYSAYVNQVLSAIEDRVANMRSEGATEDELLAWRRAFNAEITPVVDALAEEGKRREAALNLLRPARRD